MLAVFIKEMRQFMRGYARWIVLGLLVSSFAVMMLALRIPINANIILYPGLFLSLLIISGESASTWRRELGDPAFSPGITTPVPPFFIAVGKALALFCQLITTAAIYSVVFAVWRLIQFKLIARMHGAVIAFGDDVTGNLSGNFFQNLSNIFNEYGVAFLAFSLLMTTLPLAICSLKPRRKAAGVDFGSWCSVVVMALICLSEYNGMLFLNWKWRFLLKALIFSISALMLVAARVAPPASDRLLLFKTFVLLQALVINPLFAWYNADVFDKLPYSEILLTLAGNFAFIALFERLEQSRRVLNLRRPKWVSVVLFPVTTGALNSLTAGTICLIIGFCLKKCEIVNADMLISFTLLFAAAGAVNFNRVVRTWALVWFVVILGLLLAIIFLLLTMWVKGAVLDRDLFVEQCRIFSYVYFALLCGSTALFIWLLSKIYCKKLAPPAEEK